MSARMTRPQRWAGWVIIAVLTWLVGTVAGVAAFLPRERTFNMQDPFPDTPSVASSPARAVDQFPGCVPMARWDHKPADWLIVAWPDNRVTKMRFADAWTRGHNATHDDDVWVIGVCSK